MPHVELTCRNDVTDEQIARLWTLLPKVAAEQMSCMVAKKDNPGEEEYYSLDPDNEIDLVVNVCGGRPEEYSEGEVRLMKSKAGAILEVKAYAFPDRMKNIGERMSCIALIIKEILGLPPVVNVSHTFFIVDEGLWGSD